ncbi:MAG: lysophospholipid acyltransferase family protein [Kineosporiaceae bacterium]
MTAREFSTSYRFAVRLLRPPLLAVTRRDWRGAENLPIAGGFVACSNHTSHIDPLTLTHFLVDHGWPPRFLAKEALFEVPVIGRIVRGAGQIPVRRGSADATLSLAAAIAAVRAGECVAVYPEGTLTRDPNLWPMVGKTGAARIAVTAGVPVIPIAQWGAQELLEPYGKRLHVFRRPLVHVWAGPPVDLAPWQGRPLDATVLAQATDAILDAITRLLEQLRGEKAPAQRWDPRRHDQPLTGNFRRGARDRGEAP